MFRKFAVNQSGTVAVIAAIAAVPMLAAAGMAIDVSNSMRIRSDNQNALDAAVLAAVLETNTTDANATLAKVYETNGGLGSLTNVDFVADATGQSMSAKGALVKQNDFTGLIGQSTTNINVTSKATAKPTLFELKIKPNYAKGTYRKMMRLFEVPKNSAPNEVININYNTTGTVGTGTMTMTPNNSSFITIQNPSSLYFTMDIDPTSEYIYPTTILHLATNEPATSHNLFVDGKQLPANTVVNIANYVPCGKTSLFEWEDGGDFSSQDFGFDVTGNCKVNNASPVALVK
jgi:Putative Flp pilus-assembly TadE/G-like